MCIRLRIPYVLEFCDLPIGDEKPSDVADDKGLLKLLFGGQAQHKRLARLARRRARMAGDA